MTATVGRPASTDSTTSRWPGRNPVSPNASRSTPSRSMVGPWHGHLTPGPRLGQGFDRVGEEEVGRLRGQRTGDPRRGTGHARDADLVEHAVEEVVVGRGPTVVAVGAEVDRVRAGLQHA